MLKMNSAFYYLHIVFTAVFFGMYHFFVQNEAFQVVCFLATKFICLWFDVLSWACILFSALMKIFLHMLRAEKYESERNGLDEKGLEMIMETDIAILPGIIGIIFLIGGSKTLAVSVDTQNQSMLVWGSVIIFTGLIMPKIEITSSIFKK